MVREKMMLLVYMMEKMMTNIYTVIDISEAYGGESAYAVEHRYEGVVSVWTTHDAAQDEADQLEWTA
jgi:hypothetical protein